MSKLYVQSGEVVSGYTGWQHVSSGGTAIGTVITSGAFQYVSYGGRALKTVVSFGGEQHVETTIPVLNTVVSSGGRQAVCWGASASGTVLKAGGWQWIEHDGFASGTVVSSGGSMAVDGSALGIVQKAGGTVDADVGPSNVISGTNASGKAMRLSGGTASGFILYSDGRQGISSGGTAMGTVVSFGGVQTVSSRATAIGTVLYAGGWQYVSSGGTASGTKVSSGGRLIVSAGGTALGTVQRSGGKLEIYIAPGTVVSGTNALGGTMLLSKSVAKGFILYAGGIQAVSSGGIAFGTKVSSGGGQGVLNDGLASGTIVFSGGGQYVRSGGKASGTVVSSGGLQTVSSGGTALGIVQRAGGNVNVVAVGGDSRTLVSGKNAEGGAMLLSKSVAKGFILYASGLQTVSSGGTASGTKVSAGGVLHVSSAGTALGIIQHAGGNVIAEVGGCGRYGMVPTTLVSGTNASGKSMRLSGGTASAFILYAGGEQRVSDGGTAISTVVSSGGALRVLTNGSAIGVLQNSGGIVNADVFVGKDSKFVSGKNAEGRTMRLSGGIASGFVLFSGGSQTVWSAGTALETTVSAGGKFQVLPSGSALGVVQRIGGIVTVDVASGTLVSGTNASGGCMRLSGGTAKGFILYNGASQRIRASCLASGTIVSSGGSLLVSSGGLAAGAVLSSGGSQEIWISGTASSTTVSSGGQQHVFYAGTAIGTVVSSGGQLHVVSSGFLRSATISSGGSLELAGRASCLVMRASSFFYAFNTAEMYGSNRIDAVKSARGDLRLASGASLVISGKASAVGLAVSAWAGRLLFSGAGARLKSLSFTSATDVSFDIGKLRAGTITALEAATKNTQKVGAFSIAVTAQQQMGDYGITQNIVQAKNTAWTVKQGKSVLGTAKLNGSGFSKNGVTYALKAAKDKISLVLSMKAGNMLKGTAGGGDVRATANSDVFANGTGNDTFRNGNGRDCAVYGREKWGQDRITKTAGTLALVFKDLKVADVTSSLNGTTMTFAKKADARQKITVDGWDSARYSIVFGGAMSAFDAWAKAASPTAAQTSAARSEVWKKAGLAAA